MMYKLFMKKFRATLMILAFLCLGCLISIIFIITTFSLNAHLGQKIQSLEKKLKENIELYGAIPDVAVERLKLNKLKLEEKYIDFAEIFLANSMQDKLIPITPLSFKQKLFDVQDKIKDKAKNLKIVLPESLGFKEYEIDVPQQEKTPFLFKELLLAEEMVNLLLESQVFEIKNVEFPYRKDPQAYLKKIKEVTFKSYTMQLSVVTNDNHLKEFLSRLAKEENVYFVKKIDLKKINEQPDNLIVDVEITHLEI